MQKKIIALAVAGLVSGAAFAQSNVTVYGQVDMAYMHSTGDDKKSGIDSGQWAGSRLGFKGEEALGNGTKALFVLEYGLSADTNTGVATARQQYIGLSGASGTVIAGRIQSPGRMTIDKFDAQASSAFSDVNTMLAGSGTTTRTGVRLSNAVAYVSPTMSGFTAIAGYSFAGVSELDGTAYSSDQERIIGLTLGYANGPLALEYTHHRANDVGNVGNADLRDHLFAASYDFGAVKLNGIFAKNETTAGLDNKVWGVGAVVPVSAAGSVRVGYSKLNHDTANSDASSYSLSYTHSLSKRTMAFGGYQHVSNDNGSALRVFTGGATGAAVTAGDSSSGYGFGIRHNF